jgi:TATA-box binding protein (TBP) (component of TFIID and TFIIIB)
MGLGIFYEPFNKGQLQARGTENTWILIISPTNPADSDAIVVESGNVVVLGGENGGDITISTPHKIKVAGVAHVGRIQCSQSQDIVIADVDVKEGAEVEITDGTATIINVHNAGKVVVHGPKDGAQAKGGVYKAYDIVNKEKGDVKIHAGDIEVHTICPSAGKITVAEGVTGSITYQKGCKGTIDAPETVTVTELAIGDAPVATSYTITGKMEVTVSDTSFMGDAAKKASFEKAAATTIAKIASQDATVTLTADDVTVTATLKQRRLSEDPRQLSAGSIQLDWAIKMPAESKAVAEKAQETLKSTLSASNTASAFKDTLTQEVAKEMGDAAPAISALQASVNPVQADFKEASVSPAIAPATTSIIAASVLALVVMIWAI